MSEDTGTRVNLGAIVWGVLFVIVGGAFLLQEAGAWRIDGAILLPLLLITAGAVMALGSVLSPPRG